MFLDPGQPYSVCVSFPSKISYINLIVILVIWHKCCIKEWFVVFQQGWSFVELPSRAGSKTAYNGAISQSNVLLNFLEGQDRLTITINFDWLLIFHNAG